MKKMCIERQEKKKRRATKSGSEREREKSNIIGERRAPTIAECFVLL
jgi:hypothetical protein